MDIERHQSGHDFRNWTADRRRIWIDHRRLLVSDKRRWIDSDRDTGWYVCYLWARQRTWREWRAERDGRGNDTGSFSYDGYEWTFFPCEPAESSDALESREGWL